MANSQPLEKAFQKTVAAIAANAANRRQNIDLERNHGQVCVCTGCERLLGPKELRIVVKQERHTFLCLDCIMYIWNRIVARAEIT